MTSLYSPPSRIQTFFIARIPTCKRMADELCRVTLLAFFHRENKHGGAPKKSFASGLYRSMAVKLPFEASAVSPREKDPSFPFERPVNCRRIRETRQLGPRPSGRTSPTDIKQVPRRIRKVSISDVVRLFFFFLRLRTSTKVPEVYPIYLFGNKSNGKFRRFDKIADLFEFYLVIVEKELYKRDEVIEQTVYFITRNVRLLRND